MPTATTNPQTLRAAFLSIASRIGETEHPEGIFPRINDEVDAMLAAVAPTIAALEQAREALTPIAYRECVHGKPSPECRCYHCRCRAAIATIDALREGGK